MHIHGNNSLDNLILNGFSIPQVCEITFVKRGSYEKKRGIIIPHPLDTPTFLSKNDSRMSEIWYKPN
jgi:hypothetical protein